MNTEFPCLVSVFSWVVRFIFYRQFHVILFNYGEGYYGLRRFDGQIVESFFYFTQRYSLTDQRPKRDETSEPSSPSRSGSEDGWVSQHCFIVMEYCVLCRVDWDRLIHAWCRRSTLYGFWVISRDGSIPHIIFLFNRGEPPRAPRIRSDVIWGKRSGIHEGHRAEYPISPCRTRYFRSAVPSGWQLHALQGKYGSEGLGWLSESF